MRVLRLCERSQLKAAWYRKENHSGCVNSHFQVQLSGWQKLTFECDSMIGMDMLEMYGHCTV